MRLAIMQRPFLAFSQPLRRYRTYVCEYVGKIQVYEQYCRPKAYTV